MNGDVRVTEQRFAILSQAEEVDVLLAFEPITLQKPLAYGRGESRDRHLGWVRLRHELQPGARGLADERREVNRSIERREVVMCKRRLRALRRLSQLAAYHLRQRVITRGRRTGEA